MSDPIIDAVKVMAEIGKYEVAIEEYEKQREEMRVTLSAMSGLIVLDLNGDANLEVRTRCEIIKGRMAFLIRIEATHALYGEFGAEWCFGSPEITQSIAFTAKLRAMMTLRLEQIGRLIDAKRGS